MTHLVIDIHYFIEIDFGPQTVPYFFYWDICHINVNVPRSNMVKTIFLSFSYLHSILEINKILGN